MKKNNAKAMSVKNQGPVYIECYEALSMSHYAFISDWLLPSLPLKGICFITLFSTKFLFQDLNVLYGLFPFWLWTFAPRASLLKQIFRKFRVFTGAQQLRPTHPQEFPYIPKFLLLYQSDSTLHLNAFRQKPDIHELDQPFTPRPKSSQTIATVTGSVLHSELLRLSTCSGLGRSSSGAYRITIV